MDEIALLGERVKIMGDTVQTMMGRLDQILKTQDEKSAMLGEAVESLKAREDSLSITEEALKVALSEVDRAIDDLAKITAAQLLRDQKQEGAA